MVVILIRANHVGDRVKTRFVGVRLNTTLPKTSRFQDNFSAIASHKGVITSDQPILPNGIGNIGADMQLNITAPDTDQFSFAGRPTQPFKRRQDPARRYFVPSLGALPGKL